MSKIILSIKEPYVKKIFDGTKTVEYRKSCPQRKDVTHVLIYETVPIRRVVGEFRLQGILQGTPQEIWNQTASVGGIEKDKYDDYFKGRNKAYALQIVEVKKYQFPKELSYYNLKQPPQGFYYLEDEK